MNDDFKKIVEFRLGHIREQIEDCFDIIEEGKELFDDKRYIRKGSKDCLETIGEAVNAISKAYKKKEGIKEEGLFLPDYLSGLDVEWDKIKGLRNFGSHEYYKVDYDMFWNLMDNRIPELESELDKVCSSSGELIIDVFYKKPKMKQGSSPIKRFCGSLNTKGKKPCKNPVGCSIKGH